MIQIFMAARKLKVHKVLDFSSVRKIQAEKKEEANFDGNNVMKF